MPYTYSPLTSNIYISSDTIVKQPTIVTNMAGYAQNNISNYNIITEIPSGYSPTWLNTSLAQNWSYAFGGCKNLTSLPDPFYDTSNAINMSQIFSGGNNLTTIPNFNTNSVNRMSYMFYRCSNLISVPNFDTSKVTNMRYMFYYCTNLTTVPNFDTSNVTDMDYIFSGCNKLTTVPNFNTSNVNRISYMFYGCENITTVPNFNTSKATDMYRMFEDCHNLTTVPNFNTSNVTDMSAMFRNCSNLTTIPVFNLSSAYSLYCLFYDCTNIKGDLYVESNDVINAISLVYNTSNAYRKNIYCHADTMTYSSLYRGLGNVGYSFTHNAYLYTMEDNYAEIFPEPISNYSGVGSVYIVRFPTNKVQVCIPDISNSFIGKNVIEVSPYTDYIIGYDQSAGLFRLNQTEYMTFENPWWITDNPTPTTPGAPMFSFRFFKDIPNMTANVVDLL